MKILKKRGVVEKRGEEETKSMPHAPVLFTCMCPRCNTIERCEDLVMLGVLNHLNCYSYYYVIILYMKIRSFHLFIIGKYLLLTQCNNKG